MVSYSENAHLRLMGPAALVWLRAAGLSAPCFNVDLRIFHEGRQIKKPRSEKKK